MFLIVSKKKKSVFMQIYNGITKQKWGPKNFRVWLWRRECTRGHPASHIHGKEKFLELSCPDATNPESPLSGLQIQHHGTFVCTSTTLDGEFWNSSTLFSQLWPVSARASLPTVVMLTSNLSIECQLTGHVADGTQHPGSYGCFLDFFVKDTKMIST